MIASMRGRPAGAGLAWIGFAWIVLGLLAAPFLALVYGTDWRHFRLGA